MKITWIGQGGLLLESDGISVMVDPYLSNYCEKVNPQSYRRAPIDPKYLELTPDVLVFTHDHIDHYDPDTAPAYLAKTDKKMLVLGPTSAWKLARANGNGHNYVEFNPHTQWTQGGLRFYAVKAAHSDPYAIGVIIEELCTGKKLYITGDTLYNTDVVKDLPKDIYAVFLPINGVGNNMNAEDAARFAEDIGAKYAVPVHFGMFDELNPEIFKFKNRVIPTLYKEMDM